MDVVLVNFWLVIVFGVYEASVVASQDKCENRCAVIHPQQHFCNADVGEFEIQKHLSKKTI